MRQRDETEEAPNMVARLISVDGKEAWHASESCVAGRGEGGGQGVWDVSGSARRVVVNVNGAGGKTFQIVGTAGKVREEWRHIKLNRIKVM